MFQNVLFGHPLRAEEPSFVVMDARNGRVLIEQNASSIWPTGSVAHLLSLYVAWSLAAEGELNLDEIVSVSENAATQPPPTIGLHHGDLITFRNLTEIMAGRSLRDALATLAEELSGSTELFAWQLDGMAALMCLPATSFLANPGRGLTRQETTARDSAVIAWHLLNDFPQYLPLFSVSSVTHQGIVRSNPLSTLGPVFDGFATHYTPEAGWGGVFTIEREGIRLILVIFGTSSVEARRLLLAELTEQGFSDAEPLVDRRLPQLLGCPIS